MADMLAGQFRDTVPGIAEENIQSRLRGLILMGISNKHGSMVLATGNKSECRWLFNPLWRYVRRLRPT